MKELAPIILITYKRLAHTKRTVDALQKNLLAKNSELFIYSDGPKKENDKAAVEEVRRFLDTVSGFKKITVIRRENNMGLADSMIAAVTEITGKYGKVIVLEDDDVTSPHFLEFMNDALDLYEHDEKVMHVAGYIWPERIALPETFFLRAASCWGWATWKRAWDKFNGDPVFLMNEIKRRGTRKQFNFGGAHRYYNHLRANADKSIKTWAVKWYASIFLNGGLALYPGTSLTINIGNDESGMNSEATDVFDTRLAENRIKVERIPIEESAYARKRLAKFLKQTRNPLKDRIRYQTRYYSRRIIELLRSGSLSEWYRVIIEKFPSFQKYFLRVKRIWRLTVRTLACWLACLQNLISTRRTKIEITDEYPSQSGGRGLFSLFREVLNVIAFNGLCDITVDYRQTLYNDSPNQNLWDSYFEPIKNTGTKYWFWTNIPFHFQSFSSENPRHRKLFGKIIRERIRIKPIIQKEIEDFRSDNFGKKTLAVHFRGTDHIRGMSKLRFFDKAPLEKFVSRVKEISDSENFDKIFLATDDEKAHATFKKAFGEKIVSFPSFRSDRAVGVHYSGKDVTARGKEAIIDCILLSKCNYFIYGASNVTTVTNFFNPDMPGENLDIPPRSILTRILFAIIYF